MMIENNRTKQIRIEKRNVSIKLSTYVPPAVANGIPRINKT